MSRNSGAHVFFYCPEIKAAYAFWFVLANKCMSPTGTVPAITKLTCADMFIGMKDQPRSATTNTLASMLLYSIWVTRNKTVHREGLCDREGAVAIRIQLYYCPPASTTSTSNSEARIEPTISIGNLRPELFRRVHRDQSVVITAALSISIIC